MKLSKILSLVAVVALAMSLSSAAEAKQKANPTLCCHGERLKQPLPTECSGFPVKSCEAAHGKTKGKSGSAVKPAAQHAVTPAEKKPEHKGKVEKKGESPARHHQSARASDVITIHAGGPASCSGGYLYFDGKELPSYVKCSEEDGTIKVTPGQHDVRCEGGHLRTGDGLHRGISCQG